MNSSQCNWTVALALAALLASSAAAVAQTKKTGTKPPAPAANEDALQLDAPANGLGAAPPASIDLSEEFADDSVQPIPDSDRGSKQLAEQSLDGGATDASRLRELELKVDRLEQMIAGQSATLQEIADKIGAPAAELKAIHEELAKLNSKQTLARPDLGGEQPLANLGRLVVSNYTGVAYTMSVNGHPVVVAPGRSELNVPFGPVTTQIMGYEAPKTWAPTDWREANGQQQLAIQIR